MGFEDQVLREFTQSFDDAGNLYVIHFESETVEFQELSDKIYNGYQRVVKTLVHIFTDRDGQEYGGKYYYLGGMMKKFDFDIDYFEDLNYWLDDNDMDEPQFDDYFYTKESKFESEIEIKLNGDPDKLNKILTHVDNNCKWEESIVFDFNFFYDEKEKRYSIKYYSFDSAAINLAQKLFFYSHGEIEEQIHIFIVRDEFGKKMFYKESSVKVYELNSEYYDDLQEYEDNNEEHKNINRPDINTYFEEKEEIQLLK